MTPNEKLTLESIAAVCETSAALLQDVGAIYELLSIHLPGLSQSDRRELHTNLGQRLENARLLKENAKTLKSFVTRN